MFKKQGFQKDFVLVQNSVKDKIIFFELKECDEFQIILGCNHYATQIKLQFFQFDNKDLEFFSLLNNLTTSKEIFYFLCHINQLNKTYLMFESYFLITDYFGEGSSQEEFSHSFNLIEAYKTIYTSIS